MMPVTKGRLKAVTAFINNNLIIRDLMSVALKGQAFIDHIIIQANNKPLIIYKTIS